MNENKFHWLRPKTEEAAMGQEAVMKTLSATYVPPVHHL